LSLKRLDGLVRHVDTAAGHVELPAVVNAAKPALLVAAEEERGAAVGAVLAHQPHAALGVAKRDQILAEEAHLLGRAVGSRQLAGRQEGQPVLAEQLAHRRAATHAAQELVVFAREHRLTPS
jgi:hypothetical protein